MTRSPGSWPAVQCYARRAFPMRTVSRLLGILVCFSLAGCGGGSAPTAPAAPPPTGWAAGQVLQIVSGLDDAPVAGATLILGGRRLPGDSEGRVTLDGPAPDFSPIDVIAPGFLDRQTSVRTEDGARITLWPRETASGLDEQTTAELVYTEAASCCPASAGNFAHSTLTHVAPTIQAFTIVLAPEYVSDEWIGPAVRDGAALATRTAAGRFSFTVGDATTGPRIRVIPVPANSTVQNAVAYAQISLSGGYIVGGDIVIVDTSYFSRQRPYSYSVSVIAHELGHLMGFEHSTLPGVMSVVGGYGMGFQYFTEHGDYSPTEKAVLQLLYRRRPGNRFPDNDRGPQGASGRSSYIVVCPR